MYSRLCSSFLLMLAALRGCHIAQRGQTGMEVALVGVVCATCVLGGVLIASSEEAAGRFDSVFRSGLTQASGTLVLNGSVIATASGDPAAVEEIVLTLGTIGRPAPVDLDGAAATDRLAISFSSDTAFANDVAYTARELRGDGDGLLEPGETAEVRVALTDVAGGAPIGPAEGWTLQLSAPSGGLLEVSRTMPFALQAVNSLH